jgi:nucleotide-binding universal stress UspA family protein
MPALTTILAPTDFSAPSRHAAERAARLAREHGARLHLIHVVHAGALDRLRALLGTDVAVEAELILDANRQLEALAADLHDERGPEIETSLRNGSVLTEVGAQGDAIAADLVVLGARGAGFVRRIALGTTAERLLRTTRRPLLVVKQKAHERYRRVLVPVDFSPSSAQALALARRVAPDARLVLLHAYEVPFESRMQLAGVDAQRLEQYRAQARQLAHQRLHEAAAAAGLRPGDWQPCLVMQDASLAIVEQEQETDCDLIVIGKQGQGVVADFLLGSVTKHVLAESAGDVLVSTARDT